MRNQRYIAVTCILLLLSVLLAGCAETLNSSETDSTSGETTVLYEETIEYEEETTGYEEETTAFKEETITHPLIFVPEYYFDSYLPGVVPLSPAEKKEILDAYTEQRGRDCFLFDHPAFYFGLLQGYYVFWLPADVGYENEKIAGYTFTWSTSVTILVYHNGAFSKLEDLYAKGEVAEAFVGEVHARYTALCAAKEENIANNDACRHAVKQARLQAFLAAYRSSHPTDENAEIFKDFWNVTHEPLVIASVKSGDGIPTAADVYVYHVVEEEMLTLTEALDAGWLTGDAGWLTEYEYQRLVEMIGE